MVLTEGRLGFSANFAGLHAEGPRWDRDQPNFGNF